MPTILQMLGWRLFLYANGNREPIHVHARKGDMGCKFWLFPEKCPIRPAYLYGLNPRDLRGTRKLIFDLDYIVDRWQEFRSTAGNE